MHSCSSGGAGGNENRCGGLLTAAQVSALGARAACREHELLEDFYPLVPPYDEVGSLQCVWSVSKGNNSTFAFFKYA